MFLANIIQILMRLAGNTVLRYVATAPLTRLSSKYTQKLPEKKGVELTDKLSKTIHDLRRRVKVVDEASAPVLLGSPSLLTSAGAAARFLRDTGAEGRLKELETLGPVLK